MYEDINVLPNVISDYASYAYSLTLYMVDKEEYTRAESTSDAIFTGYKRFNKKAIIAESASTTLQITNLSIENIPLKYQGSFVTSLAMDINFIRGTGLEEGIFILSKELGWMNPMEVRFFLEIKFLGRTEENVQNAEIERITLPIMFTNVHVNLDSTGTIYNITAAMSSSLPNDYSYSKLPENITMDAGGNLQTFFNNLAQQLNAIEEKKVDRIHTTLPSVKHSFVLADEFKNAAIAGTVGTDTTASTKNLYSYDGNSMVTLSNGSTIPAYIDNILSNSLEVQKMVTDSDDFVLTHTIEPKVTLGEFDNLSGKETLNIEWNINSVRKRKYSSNFTTEDNIASKMFDGISAVKLYDYYHTGTSTEVKNINFDIENLYHAKIAQYLGRENRRPDSSYACYPTNNAEEFDQSFYSSARSPYEVTWSTNAQGEDVLYLDDVKINSYLFSLYEPKVIYNNTDQNTVSDQERDQRNMQYRFDLNHIRNAESSSFLKATVKIKGDPYWILPPMKKVIKYQTTRSSNTESIALIRFVHPSNEMYEGKLDDFKNSLYSGFYYVISVSSTFNNGRFEQTLNCFREPKVTSRILQNFLNSKGL